LSIRVTVKRSSSYSGIVLVYVGPPHQLSEPMRALQMHSHVVERHAEKHFRRLVIPARKTVAVEDQFLLIAYQAAGSGRKKCLSRYAHDAQSRGSIASRNGVITPVSAVIIKVILRSSICTSPATSMRTGMP